MFVAIIVLVLLAATGLWLWRSGRLPLGWARALQRRLFGFVYDAEPDEALDWSPRLQRPDTPPAPAAEMPAAIAAAEAPAAPAPAVTASRPALPQAEIITSIPRHLKKPAPPAPSGAARDLLPVIDLSDVQQNLRAGARRRQRLAAMDDKAAVAPLPLVDSADVRATIKSLHPPAAVKAPVKPALVKVVLPASKPLAPAAVPPPAAPRATPFRPASEVVAPPVTAIAEPALPAPPVHVAPPLAPAIPEPLANDWLLPPVVQPPAPASVVEEVVRAVDVAPDAAAAPRVETVAAPAPLAAPARPVAGATADIVWHLLEDEAEHGHASPPAAELPATPPALVWQQIREVALTASASVPDSPARAAIPLPGLGLLHSAEAKTTVCDQDALIERGIVIEERLAEFKVKVSVVDAYAGPVITRYEVEPAVGVRGNQVVNLMKDLSRALGLASIRVVETIPGKTCMGLELPNPTRQMIRLSEILSAEVFQDSRSKLTLCLGQDITGAPVVMDLAKAPHLLVAGTTGSGKSVGVNAMIVSMLYKATPDEVRFIMIDPKMLELSVYNDIPHLLAPVVTDMKLAANALNWCVGEMDKRYRLMSALGVRNLAGYNQKVREAAACGQRLTNPFTLTPDDPEPLEHLPFIVVVVDEFADLMMVAGKKIEELIARLAQKARAAGIHLILATQRPSVDVITGLIKANIPTRIAFQVSSKIDSRTILDQMGAESLLGQGDMLFLPPGTGYPQRVHGAFVTDDEVHAIVEHLKQYGEPDYIDGILTGEAVADEESQAAGAAAQRASETDPLYDEAVEIVLRTRKASISSVQRQLRIGYNRAARLIEEMEAAGIVSAMENNGNRTVLVPSREHG